MKWWGLQRSKAHSKFIIIWNVYHTFIYWSNDIFITKDHLVLIQFNFFTLILYCCYERAILKKSLLGTSIQKNIHPSVCLTVHLSLSLCLSVHPSVCLSLSLCLSVHPSVSWMELSSPHTVLWLAEVRLMWLMSVLDLWNKRKRICRHVYNYMKPVKTRVTLKRTRNKRSLFTFIIKVPLVPDRKWCGGCVCVWGGGGTHCQLRNNGGGGGVTYWQLRTWGGYTLPAEGHVGGGWWGGGLHTLSFPAGIRSAPR